MLKKSSGLPSLGVLGWEDRNRNQPESPCRPLQPAGADLEPISAKQTAEFILQTPLQTRPCRVCRAPATIISASKAYFPAAEENTSLHFKHDKPLSPTMQLMLKIEEHQ